MSQERPADARALTDAARVTDLARIFPALIDYLDETPSLGPADEAFAMAVENGHSAAVFTSEGSPDAQ